MSVCTCGKRFEETWTLDGFPEGWLLNGRFYCSKDCAQKVAEKTTEAIVGTGPHPALLQPVSGPITTPPLGPTP